MSREGRARRVAAAAVYGGSGLGMLGAAMVGLIAGEIKLARRWIGQPFGTAGPGADGVYGAGRGEPLVLAMLGDSTSVGLGANLPGETPGAVMATGLAALSGRSVVLREAGRVGGRSEELAGQVERLLTEGPKPTVAVIMIGANDVTRRTRPSVAVRWLEGAVRRLVEEGVEVVVGTCPDLGTIEPIAYPLRYLARRWSRQLAAAQTIAAVEAGGRTVSLGDLLGPQFSAHPKELFSSDRFHPSAAGYARAAAAMLPAVASATGYWPTDDRRPDTRAGDRIDDIATAAVHAVDTAGTEVTGAEVSGSDRGPQGRWVLLRRRRQPVAQPGPAPAVRPVEEAAASPQARPTVSTTTPRSAAETG
ncbi:SGNH/GDSL hydrolase family protein [Spongisporangium articulatum]|uniref:SGNH/GDSL hydrolase family protein n=1 Tax=Spongisporangium articulatum TaxID=3362603 RepID=A0ABW8AQM5_9ACTN